MMNQKMRDKMIIDTLTRIIVVSTTIALAFVFFSCGTSKKTTSQKLATEKTTSMATDTVSEKTTTTETTKREAQRFKRTIEFEPISPAPIVVIDNDGKRTEYQNARAKWTFENENETEKTRTETASEKKETKKAVVTKEKRSESTDVSKKRETMLDWLIIAAFACFIIWFYIFIVNRLADEE